MTNIAFDNELSLSFIDINSFKNVFNFCLQTHTASFLEMFSCLHCITHRLVSCYQSKSSKHKQYLLKHFSSLVYFDLSRQKKLISHNYSLDSIQSFAFVMFKLVAICFLLTKTIESQRIEFLEDFINNSNKTISIISVEEDFPIRNFFEKALMNFKVSSKNFYNCEEFVLTDKYRNVTSPISFSNFRQTKKFKDFIDIRNGFFCDYVIVSSSLFLESILKCLVNSYSTFLISLSDDKKLFSDRDLMVLLNKTWTDNGALKVFVQIADNVYSFDPFHRNHDGIYGKLNLFSDVTTTERLENLNGYPLKVEMFGATFTSSLSNSPKTVDDFIGPDADAAKFIANILNATSESSYLCIFCNNLTAIYVSVLLVANDGSKFGFKNPNNTFTGALKSIQTRKTDMAFIGYFIKDYETRSIEFSSPIYSDQLCVVVKKAGRIPQFILPLIIFDRTLWMFLGLETVLGKF
jgi:hypothetical protein